MTKIEFGFSQSDAYDFTVVTRRRVTCNEYTNNKKIVEKYKIPLYKNKEIDCWSHVERMTADNAPKCLKNVEYFEAVNPFGKFGNGISFEPFGWNMSLVLLAFKRGYIDGFFSSSGSFFDPFSVNTEGIIIVDPIQRIEVRKYFENEYKEFLSNCNEDDFEYSVGDYRSRIGTDNKRSMETIRKELIEESRDKEHFFLAKHEKQAVAKYGFDKVFDALVNLVYYTTDLINIWGQRTANPLLFSSLKEANEFIKQYNEWENIYAGENKKGLVAIPVNEKFDNWLRNKINSELDETA